MWWKYLFDLFDNSFFNNKISSKGASLLFNTLRKRKSIVETINLSSNELDDDCIESLGEFIQNSHTIKNINISGNNITDKGIEILLPYLIGNIALKILIFHIIKE